MQIPRQQPKKSLASRCRNYVTIQAENKVSDGEGGFTEDWTDIATQIPAEILPITAVRRAELRSFNVVATHYIRIRSNIPIDEVGRIVYGSRVFYVHTVEDIQTRGVEQFIIAEERRP